MVNATCKLLYLQFTLNLCWVQTAAPVHSQFVQMALATGLARQSFVVTSKIIYRELVRENVHMSTSFRAWLKKYMLLVPATMVEKEVTKPDIYLNKEDDEDVTCYNCVEVWHRPHNCPIVVLVQFLKTFLFRPFLSLDQCLFCIPVYADALNIRSRMKSQKTQLMR